LRSNPEFIELLEHVQKDSQETPAKSLPESEPLSNMCLYSLIRADLNGHQHYIDQQTVIYLWGAPVPQRVFIRSALLYWEVSV